VRSVAGTAAVKAARPGKSLHKSAATYIGRRIVTGEWPVGAAIPNEAELSRELSVSRASLREAIKILAGKGLVRSAPRRGTVVQPSDTWNRLDPDVLVWQASNGPSLTFVRDLFELRRMIEPEAAALTAVRGSAAARAAVAAAFADMADAREDSAAIHADLEFHKSILLGTGNELIAAFVPAMEATLSVSFRDSRRAIDDFHPVLKLHGAIAAAIEAADGDGAREAMRLLLVRAEDDSVRAVTARDGTATIAGR
jgi:GntR family galactonate operon transcriptional repressor